MKKIAITSLSVFIIILFWASSGISGNCKKHIELYSAKEIAQELGSTEDYVVRSYQINVWAKQTANGKGRAVGRLRPGSRALIIQEGPDDYKIKSPLDDSIGWASRSQVKSTLIQDAKTFEPCR